MNKNIVFTSSNFKKQTVKAISAIFFFVFSYILLVILSICLTVLCGYAGIMLVALKPMFITLMIGLGLVSMGLLTIIFLLKFLAQKHTVDRSYLIEISASDEPRLFEFIQSIVIEVKTEFPKKIYLSNDVNASVFYDSSFWSMFLPIKKNLQIGLGLVNSVSEEEFKAILAHEFGHFSQRTMKIGSYVYNVNRVIYNMLYDNDSYLSLAQDWANVSSYFSIFVNGAVRIVFGIQWILRKVYNIVNLNHMSLSREMEFHADAVAAHVTGSKPLITSLLRLDLANQAYQTVLGYYDQKIDEAVKTKNLYDQQLNVMNFLAMANKLPFEQNLPQVHFQHLSRYNKTKLVIKDQWASHPSTVDRVAALENLNIEVAENTGNAAWSLFSDPSKLQQQLTEHLFSGVEYSKEETFIDTTVFMNEFTGRFNDNSFNEVFNGYYDTKNPLSGNDLIGIEEEDLKIEFDQLFGDEILDLVYTFNSLETDIVTLKQIYEKTFGVKSFDYDGNRYTPEDCFELIATLEREAHRLKTEIIKNDKCIYLYFKQRSMQLGRLGEFEKHVHLYHEIDLEYDTKEKHYVDMLNAANFIYDTTPFDIIEQKIQELTKVEVAFKQELEKMMSSTIFQLELNKEMRKDITKYLSQDWVYFKRPNYDNDALEVMMKGIKSYQVLLSATIFKVKKNYLNFMAELELVKDEKGIELESVQH
ncbi:M48 family metalloprotease [Solitalea lacus]|uniref:M48 family metalloprotease n=1 Tax=Solitalea lacus TaxID=2911172 RepID=UPI001EDB1D7D|nr:M48 family metallopeptidase [Solitalea lacus]UKJ08436.1 M48 family metallopeptidase [Solitalea lacus]